MGRERNFLVERKLLSGKRASRMEGSLLVGSKLPSGKRSLHWRDNFLELYGVLSLILSLKLGTGFGDIPQETLLVADIVIRHFPSLRYTVAGRSVYQPPAGNEKHSLGNATEMWTGVYTSARPSNWGLVLNVDESHTAFYEEQPVLDFMTKHLNIRGNIQNNFSLRDSDRTALEKQLKYLRVSVKHQAQKRQYRYWLNTLDLNIMIF